MTAQSARSAPSYLDDAPNADAYPDQAIARNILKCLPDHKDGAISLGIYGPWGSGKSTLLKALYEQCKQQKHPVLLFEPWRYEHTESLIVPLLAELSASFVQKVENSTRGKLTKTKDAALSAMKTLSTRLLGRAARLAMRTAADSLPIPFSGKIADGLEDFGRAVAAAYQEPSRFNYPASEIEGFKQDFKALIDCAQKAVRGDPKKRLTIFIDDLDRCAPNQVRRLLESLKTLLWENGVCFVFALDRHQVELAIAESYLIYYQSADDGLMQAQEKANRYLEKFFPFSVDLSGPDGLLVNHGLLIKAQETFWQELSDAFPKHERFIKNARDLYGMAPHNLRQMKAVVRWLHMDLIINPDKEGTKRASAFATFIFAQSYPRLWIEFFDQRDPEISIGLYENIAHVSDGLIKSLNDTEEHPFFQVPYIRAHLASPTPIEINETQDEMGWREALLAGRLLASTSLASLLIRLHDFRAFKELERLEMLCRAAVAGLKLKEDPLPRVTPAPEPGSIP